MAQSIDWTIIARIVGVEIGEPFKIEASEDVRKFLGDWGIEDDFYNVEFCIFDNGLIICNGYCYTFDDYGEDVFISVVIGGILNGLITIKRKRCKPEDGDDYYYVAMDKNGYRIAAKNYFANYFDLMNYVNGNCFKTREEALNAAENIYKEFKDKIDSIDKNQYI